MVEGAGREASENFLRRRPRYLYPRLTSANLPRAENFVGGAATVEGAIVSGFVNLSF